MEESVKSIETSIEIFLLCPNDIEILIDRVKSYLFIGFISLYNY